MYEETAYEKLETWYLPHSRVNHDRQCLFSIRIRESIIFLFLFPVYNLTLGTVNIVNLRHRAKFRGDRSNR